MLEGSRCRRCGTQTVPPLKYCPGGCGATTDKTSVSPWGTLYASTTIHLPHPDFGKAYTVGYVDLDSGPRLFGHLAEPLDIGDRVSVTRRIKRLNGKAVTVYTIEKSIGRGGHE